MVETLWEWGCYGSESENKALSKCLVKKALLMNLARVSASLRRSDGLLTAVLTRCQLKAYVKKFIKKYSKLDSVDCMFGCRIKAFAKTILITECFT